VGRIARARRYSAVTPKLAKSATKVISVCATKGGVGKTTLAACIAVRAAQDHPRVAMIDCDPQGSLGTWWSRRAANRNPRIVPEAGYDVEAEVDELKRQGWDYVIIDTPPAFMDLIERTVLVADYVLLPVKASSLDVVAIDPVIELCTQHRVPFGIVVNDAEPEWRITTNTVTALGDLGEVLGMVAHRRAYVTPMSSGRTGPEDKQIGIEASEEIEALWQRILAGIEGGRQ
jgi:chromosome partitioning protein